MVDPSNNQFDAKLKEAVKSAISNPAPIQLEGKSEDKVPATGLKSRMRERRAHRSMVKLEKKQRRMNNSDEHDGSPIESEDPPQFVFDGSVENDSGAAQFSNGGDKGSREQQPGLQIGAPTPSNEPSKENKDLEMYIKQVGGEAVFHSDMENPNGALLERHDAHQTVYFDDNEDYSAWNRQQANDRSRRHTLVTSVLFVFALVLCIALAVVLGQRSPGRSAAESAHVSGLPDSLKIRAVPPYPALPTPPDFTGTSSPLTRNAWTEGSLKAMLEAFVHSSLLEDTSSPQGKAFEWLRDASGELRGLSSTRIQQRYALASIFYSLQKVSWKNSHGWLTKSHECSWYGVMCGDDGYSFEGVPVQDLVDAVTYIDLSENDIQGSLPVDFSLFPMLSMLSLAENLISGTIPDGLFSRFHKLRTLLLKGNLLEGTIPNQFSSMESVEIIDFGFNSLSGQIPVTLSFANTLVDLRLGNNELTGGIPHIFSRMDNLEVFIAGNNELIGEVPPEIGRLPKLKTIQVHENKLTGIIPDFESTNLQCVHFDNNGLSGTIPFFRDNVPLGQLRLERNKLEGILPIRLGDHVGLELLHLNNNDFSGTLPHEYGRLEKLKSFQLEGNRLTGEVPESVCDLILYHTLLKFNPKCDGSNQEFACDCCTTCYWL